MTTTNPIGPSSSNHSNYYPYGGSPYGWTSTVTSPVLSDNVSVVCPECGMRYAKWATSVAVAQSAVQVWLDQHLAAQHADAGPQSPADDGPQHATMADGTVLREQTAKSLGLCGNGVSPSSRGLRRLAAQHLDTAVLQQSKSTLDEADMTALATLVSGALDS